MKLNIFTILSSAGLMVQAVLLILVAASVVSWSIIFMKVRILRRSRRNSESFIELFWGQKNMESTFRKAEEMDFCPVAGVFKAGYMELIKTRESARAKGPNLDSEEVAGILESVERSLRRSATAQTTILERRVPFLATTGSSAPFVGLFGTVWGIMEAFLKIGETQSTSLAAVAPGISEALIATAVGLLAAIPAVVGYNYCVSQIRFLTREMDNFSNDFLNLVKRQLGAAV